MQTYEANKFANRPAVHPIARHATKTDGSAGFSNIVSKTLITIIETIKNRYQRHIDRQAFMKLVDLDDPILDDIGVTRSEVLWASSLPLSQNAAIELEKTALTRRHNKHAAK